MDGPVMAHGVWKTNGELIADAARCGYLNESWSVLDPTYGLGSWWTDFKPEHLTASDLDTDKSPWGTSIDFRLMPWETETFDAVVFDPPYKLNGTATLSVDARYGVHEKATRTARHRLMCSGLIECGRVVKKGGFVLAKCQDQIEGGKMRWQTTMLTEVGEWVGLTKVDRFHMPSYRAQPDGVSQKHARNNFSTLLIFRKDDR